LKKSAAFFPRSLLIWGPLYPLDSLVFGGEIHIHSAYKFFQSVLPHIKRLRGINALYGIWNESPAHIFWIGGSVVTGKAALGNRYIHMLGDIT
jgi:hypothetical protein